MLSLRICICSWLICSLKWAPIYTLFYLDSTKNSLVGWDHFQISVFNLRLISAGGANVQFHSSPNFIRSWTHIFSSSMFISVISSPTQYHNELGGVARLSPFCSDNPVLQLLPSLQEQRSLETVTVSAMESFLPKDEETTMRIADVNFLAWLRNFLVVKVYRKGFMALLIGRIKTTTQAYKSSLMGMLAMAINLITMMGIQQRQSVKTMKKIL